MSSHLAWRYWICLLQQLSIAPTVTYVTNRVNDCICWGFITTYTRESYALVKPMLSDAGYAGN